jgi:polyether ionophore transport system permease protein
MTATGLRTMLGVQWRTHRRGTLVWTFALIAMMVGTAGSIAGLYTTPEKIHSYAQAVTAGDALVAINGRVEGIDSLGGIIQDEFGFLAAFLLPLLGISLVARVTRSEEEAGRLETILAGRVARHVPVLAGLVLASAAILVTTIAFALGLIAFGVPATGAVLYATSLGALAFVFAGLAALLAQVTLHSRGVYTWGLLVLAVAYMLRGVGDVTKTWVTWLSPLGWAEKAAPFGDMRWWTLLIPLAIGGLLATLAILIAGRRDLGSSLIRGGAGPERATTWLRSPLGLATAIHRPAILGWLAGALILAGMMGALAQQFVDAVLGNPAMAEALGLSGAQPQDGIVAITQLYTAIIATGYAVQAVGSLRGEETAGRLEMRLSGTLSRVRWLAAHGLIIVTGLVAIVVVSSVVLAVGMAWSMGSALNLGRVLGAGAAYLPAELLVGGLALALFGLRPRAFPAGWVALAFIAFIAFLGPGLKLPSWLLDLSPTSHVGNPPLGTVEALPLVVLGAIAAVLGVAAAVGFRRRGVPQS